MKSLQSIILLLLFPALGLSLSKRTCESFEPKGKNGKEGYTTYARPVRVSEAFNCTKEAGRQDGDSNGNCNFDRYKMGIAVNSTVNVSVSDIQTVLEAVRDAVDPETVESVNLNSTVVMPFTVPQNTMPNGTSGWYTFAPKQRCWEGRLGECDGDDEDKDETMVEVCGWVFLNGGNNQSARTYDGRVSFFETNDTELEENRPYPEYEAAVEHAKKAAEDSGATQHVSISTVSTCLVWLSIAPLVLFI